VITAVIECRQVRPQHMNSEEAVAGAPPCVKVYSSGGTNKADKACWFSRRETVQVRFQGVAVQSVCTLFYPDCAHKRVDELQIVKDPILPVGTERMSWHRGL